MTIQVCVGSSCHIKGSSDIAAMFQKAVAEHGLEDDVTIIGSFCLGTCSSTGVTVQVDDTLHLGVTKENFSEFFAAHVLKALTEEKE